MGRTAAPRPGTEAGAPKARDPGGLIGMAEAIALLATTRPTFYRWLAAGAVTGVKLGRQWRFRREDIDRFLKGEGPRVESASDFQPLIAALRSQLGERGAPASGDQASMPSPAASAIRLALHLKASDLHLLARQGSGALHLRIDGGLVEIAQFSNRLVPLLCGRLKRMAGLDTDITDQAQAGQLEAVRRRTRTRPQRHHHAHAAWRMPGDARPGSLPAAAEHGGADACTRANAPSSKASCSHPMASSCSPDPPAAASRR